MQINANILKRGGARIRQERLAKQIKQETLAKEVNLSKSEISRIENGRRGIKVAKLFEIANAIGIKTEVLQGNKFDKFLIGLVLKYIFFQWSLYIFPLSLFSSWTFLGSVHLYPHSIHWGAIQIF